MSFGTCTRNRAFLYDRGALRLLGEFERPTKIEWDRERDETTEAKVHVSLGRNAECDRTAALVATDRHELVVFRDGRRVWEGPIVHASWKGSQATFKARDVSHYWDIMIMRNEYDNSYPNMTTVIERMGRIMREESVRFESLVPPYNIRDYIVEHNTADDAGTAAHTLPYEAMVMEHLENMAKRAGLDYTVVGRATHLWDVHNRAMGTTPVVTEEDFIGDIEVSEYGLEAATYSAVTDGKGNYGDTGGVDDFYGLIEKLQTATDEDDESEWDNEGESPPSEAEMASQAARFLTTTPPMELRVPSNSQLNPDGVLRVDDLIPGVMIPVQVDVPGKKFSQLQKLDSVSVEDDENGEVIKVSMSQAPAGMPQ